MNRITSRIRCGLFVDRTGQTLLIAALLLLCGGSFADLRPELNEEPACYWYDKLSWRGNANVVLLGDSRTNMGLSPGAMTKELHGLRIRNFSFNSVGYSNDYLDAAERVWDPHIGPKVAVFGITPHSLCRAAAKNNQFLWTSASYGPVAQLKARLFGWVERRWPALVNHRQFKQFVLGNDQPYLVTRRHSDGWAEALPVQINPQLEMQSYRERLQQNPVSHDITNLVLHRTRDWTAQGILVYAFRPPTCEAMEEIENKVGRFEERSFVRAFEDAGGCWLSPTNKDLQTFDGSHLDARSAEALSTHVARLISISRQMISERADAKSDTEQR